MVENKLGETLGVISDSSDTEKCAEGINYSLACLITSGEVKVQPFMVHARYCEFDPDCHYVSSMDGFQDWLTSAGRQYNNKALVRFPVNFYLTPTPSQKHTARLPVMSVPSPLCSGSLPMYQAIIH